MHNKNVPYLCALLFIACVSMFFRYSFVPLFVSTDTVTYTETTRLFRGEDAQVYPFRLLKPLAPLAIGAVATVTDLPLNEAFILLNITLYLLTVFVVFFFVRIFTNDDLSAFLGATLYITAYPMLFYGLDLYTEIGAWLFFLLTLLFGVYYYMRPTWKIFFLTALAASLGILWKEYSILGGLFFGLVLVFHPLLTIKEKIIRVFFFGLLCAVIIMPVLWWVYVQYHYTYLDWFHAGANPAPAEYEFTPYYIAKSLFAVFLLGWCLVGVGLLRIRNVTGAYQRLLLFLFLSSLLFLGWKYVSSRLYFVTAPLLTVLASLGVGWLQKRWLQVSLVALVVAGNLFWLVASGGMRVFFQ